ncbi:MAG: hypothetical protein ACYDCN_16760 [Bacteroidia bacterium]
MKKAIIIKLTVAIFSCFFASCKKSYNCTCTITTAPTYVVTYTAIGIDDTWQNAQWACHYRNTAVAGSQTVTCWIQ